MDEVTFSISNFFIDLCQNHVGRNASFCLGSAIVVFMTSTCSVYAGVEGTIILPFR